MWQTGRHILMARSEDIRRPRTTSGHRNDVAASETPHGASLHWGESAVVEDKLTPMGVRAQHVYWYVTTSKPATSPPGRFTLFESGQVRPLALSPDRPPDPPRPRSAWGSRLRRSHRWNRSWVRNRKTQWDWNRQYHQGRGKRCRHRSQRTLSS